MPTRSHHLHLDLETRSAVDLKRTGVYPYAADRTTDVLCAAYAFDGEDVELWLPGQPVPLRIKMHVAEGGAVLAWNSMFERLLWRHVLGPRYGWPEMRQHQWMDPMVWALAMAFPAQLDQCARAMLLKQAKDLEGRRIMLQLAKPRKIKDDGTIVWWNDPIKLQRLYEYCKQDVVVERELAGKLLPLSDREYQYWVLDQHINDRGVQIDLPLVRAAQEVVDRRLAKLDAEMDKVTGGAVWACTQVAKLGDWLRTRGYPVSSLDKEAIEDLLHSENLPPDVERALTLRRWAAKTSNSKLVAMENVAGADGRARGCFQFHKAGTGRWASTHIQLHNLPRGDEEVWPVDEVCTDLLRGDDDYIEVMWGDPLDAVSNVLRGCIVAAPDHVLVCRDYAQIEARINAHLAGQNDVLEVFARGDDVYVYTAQKIGSDNRTLGKVIRLALGFGMGAAKFVDTAAKYGIELDEEEAQSIVSQTRHSDDAITQFWYDLENAAIRAVRFPGKKFQLTQCDVTYKVANGHLWCRLPSGRALCYPFPKLEMRPTPWGAEKETLTYWGLDGYTRAWTKQYAYGGLLCENVVQGVAADVLREAQMNLDEQNIPVVAHVHDEVIAEIPRTHVDALVPVIDAAVSRVPVWLEGCPIVATGFTTTRYRKG